MKWFMTPIVGIIGFILGVASVLAFIQLSRDGITLRSDIAIYAAKEPIGQLKEGTILIRDKVTHDCYLRVYLFQSQFDVHEPQDTYYADKPLGSD